VILPGDCRETLTTLAPGSVHMAVTSPPYWGLRSYLPADHPLKALEIGSEPTPEAFIANLIDVFRAVRRVLRDDGTVWVNLGDTYGGSRGNKMPAPNTKWAIAEADTPGNGKGDTTRLNRVGIPERFALAMQADGWYWRDTIIWHKPAPMPTSVNGWRWERCRVKTKSQWETGTHPSQTIGLQSNLKANPASAEWRPCPGCPKCRAHDGWVLRKGSWRHTCAHEYIFMFSKGPKYMVDAEAVKVIGPDGIPSNPRSVWTIGPQPLKHKHYAAYPEELPRRCILAGTPDKGCCPKCGSPWARMVELDRWNDREERQGLVKGNPNPERHEQRIHNTNGQTSGSVGRTVGWLPTCDCNAGEPVPCTVLDPFGGSGTTAIAARMMGRNAISCELNQEYIDIMAKRDAETAPLLLGSNA
jgi:DNA modification methylase